MSEPKAEYKIEGMTEWQTLYSMRTPIEEYHPGIYFLFRGEEIVYVGKSLWATARVFVHQRDKDKDFDSFTILSFLAEQLDDKELEYICKFRPVYNNSLTANLTLKTKRGWATTLGIKVGVVGKHIRKNKILPYVILRGRSYYHRNDMGEL